MSLTHLADLTLADAVANGPAPGVVAMATSATETIYAGATGVRAVDTGTRMSTNTVFWIASMTKPLTTVAAMQLVEGGRLDLDSPASRWLPALGRVRVFDGLNDNGVPVLRQPRRALTLRHLLTHTSGWTYPAYNLRHQVCANALQVPQLSTCKFAALHMPLMFDPGERWEYGMSTDWVGRLIETIAGESLGSYLHRHVLEPLGMHETTFVLSNAQRERLAKIHSALPSGVVPLDFSLPDRPEIHLGGGGLYATGEDYLKFIRMLLNRGRVGDARVLREDTIAQMFRGQGIEIPALASAMPELSATLDLAPEAPRDWGLGFQINCERLATGRAAGSVSWMGMANTYFWADITRGVGGVYLTQMFPFGDARTVANVAAFERAIYQEVTTDQ